MVTYLCYVVMMLSSISAFSLGDGPPSPKPGVSPPGVPIDGGISFLLILGAVYGVYVLKKNKKSLLKG